MFVEYSFIFCDLQIAEKREILGSSVILRVRTTNVLCNFLCFAQLDYFVFLTIIFILNVSDELMSVGRSV